MDLWLAFPTYRDAMTDELGRPLRGGLLHFLSVDLLREQHN